MTGNNTFYRPLNHENSISEISLNIILQALENVKNGEVIRISTGAAVPPGADIVIPVENTYVKEKSGDGEELHIGISFKDPAQNIR